MKSILGELRSDSEIQGEGVMNLITFVVPAYNVKDYIAECIESIMNQTCSDYSVVIVNDGSTDGDTEKICKQYQEKYPEKIQYIFQKNRGLGAARNTGMKYVDTPWITFLDSDDWIGPNYVEDFKRELKRFESKTIDLFFTLPTIYENVTQNCRDWYDKELFYQVFYSGSRIVNPEMEKQIYKLEVNACRRIYRRGFIQRLHFQFPEGVKWEDVYPHFYLLSQSNACAGIDTIGFYYRVGTSGQITASSDRGRLDIVKVFAQTLEYLINNNVEDEIIMIAINTMINFSRWSMEVADIQTRKELLIRLRKLYNSIPQPYLNRYSKKEYKRDYYFVKAVQSKHLSWTLQDYLIKSIVVRVINKVKKGRKNENNN